MFQTAKDALAFLDQVAAQAPIPRQQHAIAQEAVKVLAAAIAGEKEAEVMPLKAAK